MEYFNNALEDPSPSVPPEHAKRASDAYSKIQKEFGLPDHSDKA